MFLLGYVKPLAWFFNMMEGKKRVNDRMKGGLTEGGQRSHGRHKRRAQRLTATVKSSKRNFCTHCKWKSFIILSLQWDKHSHFSHLSICRICLATSIIHCRRLPPTPHMYRLCHFSSTFFLEWALSAVSVYCSQFSSVYSVLCS